MKRKLPEKKNNISPEPVVKDGSQKSKGLH
jgi:hypothetical protein